MPRCGLRAEHRLRGASARPNVRGSLLPRPDGPDADVLVAEVVEPGGERTPGEDAGQLGRERFLIVVVLAIGELRAVDELAEPAEELRLERADGEVAAVGRGIDAVTREARP